jgi:3-oxoadipate enol-lactonase
MPIIRVNGAALYYEEHGTGPETIVFAHGLLWSCRMFVARWFGLGLVVDRVMPVMFGRTFLTDPARALERREWRRRMSGNHRLGVTRATTGVITRKGIESEIDRIRVPTLILVGDEDVAVPVVHSQRLHERIAGSRLEIIPRAGHTSTVEEPTAVNVAITNFLGSLS